ncbi:MAG TPA: hypothetical protein VML55_06335 [Planctomycetaceae bacterium]|nr:hypothetical protein [Planctomycetaceae bacterium]
MLEVALGIALCVIIGKIADADGQSGIIWGAVTFLLCFASLAIALPFLRILFAGVAAVVLMIAWKAIAGR